MGLFSGGTKTYVATSITHMIEDKKFIPSTLSGTIKAIFNRPQPGSIPEYVMEDLVNSIGLTAKRYYRYGGNGYLYGLPKGQGISSDYGAQLVQPILNQSEGQLVGMAYCFYGPFNYAHQAFFEMDQRCDFNYLTYELRTITAQLAQTNSQQPVAYLTGIVLEMSQATYDSLPVDALKSRSKVSGAYGHFDFLVNAAVGNRIKMVINYQYSYTSTTTEGDTVSVTQPGSQEVSDIRLAVYDPAKVYFHACYKVGTNYKYWAYQVGAGVYDTLDTAFTLPHTSGGTYMPWVYFRYGKVRGNEDKNADWYKSSRKMMKKISMDYDKVCDAIHDNPDIADVEQAFLWWAVEADSTDAQDREYLYRYFDARFNEMGGMPYDLNHEDLTAAMVATLVNDNAMTIQDARFKMALTHRGMYRRLFAGVIGPVGSYSAGELALLAQYQAYQESEGGSVAYMAQESLPSHYYRKQITPGYYEEILVLGMEMRYFIYGDYSTAANGDTNDTRTDLLVVPVDMALCNEMSLLQKERFFSRSLRLSFNSRVTVKLAWYQSTLFEFAIIIAAFAIAVYTGQFAALDSFIAATASMTAVQVITAIAVTGLQYIAVSTAFKLFVKVVGVKIAFVVAIIAMAAGVATKFDALPSALTESLPNAADLLKVGTQLSKAVNAEIAGDLTGMAREMESLQTEAARLDKELSAAADALYQDSRLAAFINPAEMPEDFFNRTVHTGNIGMMSIDAVGNYVERMLTLPTLNDTLGEFV